MDDLLELFDDDEDDKALSQDEPATSTKERLALTADSQVDIRMKNRRISGADLMDILTSHPHHSPASLASFSLKKWNEMLVEKAAVLDVATVRGRTQLVTVGVVLNSSGTRTSKSGNGFCAIGIGNFRTGACVSVLAFGAAYRESVKSAVPGKVVVVLTPSLLPTENSKSASAVTLSVNDPDQLRIVADAQDYGTCSFRMFRKGQPEGKKCGAVIDIRHGPCCSKHQKHSTSKVPKNRMEKLREQHSSGGTVTLKRNPMVMRETHRAILGSSRNFDEEMKQHSRGKPRKTVSGGKTTAKRKNPLLTSTNQLTTLATATSKRSLPTFISNPYIQRDSTICKQNLATLPEPPQRKAVNLCLANPKSGAKSTKRVNTAFLSNHDGSVPIPQPKQFSKTVCVAADRFAKRKDAKDETDMVEKQRLAADKIRKMKGRSSKSSTGLHKSTLVQNREEQLFSILSKGSVAGIEERKSRFESELEAEEYARARQAVSELESKEENELKRKQKSGKDISRIKQEWICLTCRQQSTKRPKNCAARGHCVKRKRSIRQGQPTDEARVALSNKSALEGGIVLGKGLEWSQGPWNTSTRFS